MPYACFEKFSQHDLSFHNLFLGTSTTLQQIKTVSGHHIVLPAGTQHLAVVANGVTGSGKLFIFQFG